MPGAFHVRNENYVILFKKDLYPKWLKINGVSISYQKNPLM